MQNHLRILIASLLLTVTTPALSQKLPLTTQEEVVGQVRLNIVDLTPRFLDFYAAASELPPEQRFAEWKSRYGFAAIPPTPEGDAIARELIDSAWPKYENALPTIREGYRGMQPKPAQALERVLQLLQSDAPSSLQFNVYVGGFEGNAFTAFKTDGTPVVSIPVEMSPDDRARIMPHEFTHAVHAQLAFLSRGYERTLARVIFEEGLAMHVAKAVGPRAAVEDYIEHSPGWFAKAMEKRHPILTDLMPHLSTADQETVFKYTMGTGSQGFEREAYLAGWLVIGQLLADGFTFAELARVPEHRMPQLVETTVRKLLEDQSF
ncbi:hypothetical protein [Tsuneonella sp. SYSU-LHT278]|uniref:hypothetical protein n=1 Tax=Tsuneonella sediminis TaxID=3416089 RepID=UPI003F79A575